MNGNGAPPGKDGAWLRLALLAALAAVLLWRTGAHRIFLERDEAVAFIRELGGWGFVGFVLLQALQVVAAPFPGEITGVLGGFLFGPLAGIALSTVGLTLGSWMAFSIARVFGRPAVERLVAADTLGKFDFILHQKGIALAFLLFLIPGFPKDYLCYILGLGHLTTLEFLIVSAAGRLLGTVMLTAGGALLAEKRYAALAVLALCAVAILAALGRYRKRLEARFHEWQARRLRDRKGRRKLS
jgi:uncharacterized membrane protein YdjX (TVP38/TMEM64 family)